MSDLDQRHLDKRTSERYLRSGQLDEKLWEKHLKALPDLTDKSIIVDTLPEDDDFDAEDDADTAE